MSLQHLLGLQKETGTWVPSVQEVTDEQGGLCDGSVNRPVDFWRAKAGMRAMEGWVRTKTQMDEALCVGTKWEKKI